MKVYRVEHPNTGWGPYCCPFDMDDDTDYHAFWNVRWGAMAHHDNSCTHPSPYESMQYVMKEYDRCGFHSLDALLSWFDGAMEELENLGFQVLEYHVPDSVIAGPDDFGQVVFPVHHGEVVSRC